LEARIVPKRIEHGIEPEQCGSVRQVIRELYGLLFRRERGDNFLKARIAAKRVPEGQRTSLEGVCGAWGDIASWRADWGKRMLCGTERIAH
jgi:hypothetical protein